jgi:hypothetical protein
MEFDTKRFLQLAGIADNSSPATAAKTASLSPRTRQALVESAPKTPARSLDEDNLRSLIRREARKMISERMLRAASHDISSIQTKKSLTEAITLGFMGLGFGGKSPILGGPMTSASRFASLDEVLEEEEAAGKEPEPTEEADESDAY